mgnify:CR=1 FL=1
MQPEAGLPAASRKVKLFNLDTYDLTLLKISIVHKKCIISWNENSICRRTCSIYKVTINSVAVNHLTGSKVIEIKSSSSSRVRISSMADGDAFDLNRLIYYAKLKPMNWMNLFQQRG